METKKNWQEWKSTVLGILAFILPVAAMFYPNFTVENQKVFIDSTGQLFEAGAVITGAITAIILVFKTSFGKK